MIVEKSPKYFSAKNIKFYSHNLKKYFYSPHHIFSLSSQEKNFQNFFQNSLFWTFINVQFSVFQKSLGEKNQEDSLSPFGNNIYYSNKMMSITLKLKIGYNSLLSIKLEDNKNTHDEK